MTQTLPLTAALGAGKTGLTIGYRVLNIDRTEYSAFTTTGVAEGNVAGTYYVEDGIVAPDAGGYVVVGESGDDLLDAGIDPAPAKAGDAMDLVAGSISQSKFVEDAIQPGTIDASTYAYIREAIEASEVLAKAGADSDTLKTLSEQIDALAASGAGSGTGTYTDTITVDGVVADGVRVQLSTDSGGTNRVYETYTNALGVFTLHPDPGTYYRWLDLAGATFTQGVQVVVT